MMLPPLSADLPLPWAIAIAAIVILCTSICLLYIRYRLSKDDVGHSVTPVRGNMDKDIDGDIDRDIDEDGVKSAEISGECHKTNGYRTPSILAISYGWSEPYGYPQYEPMGIWGCGCGCGGVSLRTPLEVELCRMLIEAETAADAAETKAETAETAETAGNR